MKSTVSAENHPFRLIQALRWRWRWCRNGVVGVDGGGSSARDHRRDALRHGQRSVLHPQGRSRPPEAHRQRRVGRGHGEAGQEARGGPLLRSFQLIPVGSAPISLLSECQTSQ
ncbi:hypothetical protein NL676_001251 [Syzygium grande]|nr:hypothetical protein NL676_001251 [Syzygium grande]